MVRYQQIQLFPIYKFTVSGNEDNGTAVPIVINQNVTGVTSGAQSEVLRVIGSDVYVKIKNSVNFDIGEQLFFSTQSAAGGDLEDITVTSLLMVSSIRFLTLLLNNSNCFQPCTKS